MADSALVIGGSRNLGPDLVATLLAQNYTVTVLNRGKSGFAHADTEQLIADRTDPIALADALAGKSFDLAVDTTLYTGPDAGVVAEVLGGRVGRYIWWSTGQVYLVRQGPLGPVPPFRESDYDGPVMRAPDPANRLDFRNWEYGVNKRAAEDTLQTAFLSREFPTVSLRMPMINSERDSYGRIASYARRIKAGEAIVTPEESGPPLRHVYGKDVVAATLRAANAPVAGQRFNIGQDETLELKQMLDMIGAIVGRKPRLEFVPRAELEGQGFMPASSPFADRWMSSLDNSLSKSDLGMKYTKVADYLPICVAAGLLQEPR